jgi:hypothetical protein
MIDVGAQLRLGRTEARRGGKATSASIGRGAQRRVTKLDIQYQDEIARYNGLQKEVSALEENLRIFPSAFTSLTSAFRPRKNTR